MEKIIRIENLDFSYDKILPFIKGMNLEIPARSYTCIIGANGSGKSTLSRLISGLLSSDKGDVFVDGIMVNNQNIAQVRKTIGVIFQNPDNQYMASSLKEDIIFALENHGVNPNNMDDIIFDVANRCGITHLLNKSPSSMSGGEKQKGNLAGILALNPKILILDEAYNMLDGQSKKEMKSMIANMRENGKTIISITHDSEELLLADYIVLLDNGKIVFSGTKEELFEFDVTPYNVELPYIMQLEKAMGYTSFISEEVFLNKVGETLWR